MWPQPMKAHLPREKGELERNVYKLPDMFLQDHGTIRDKYKKASRGQAFMKVDAYQFPAMHCFAEEKVRVGKLLGFDWSHPVPISRVCQQTHWHETCQNITHNFVFLFRST